MSNQQELIAQFIDVTGCKEDRAKFYLESANWTLHLALSSFYEGADNDAIGEDMQNISGLDVPPPLVPATVNAPQSSNVEGADSFKSVNTTETSEKSWNSKSMKPKVATLFNTKQKSSDDEEEERQEFYAGGSERSGQQVLGPPRHKNLREQLTQMFRAARDDPSLNDQPEPSSSRQALQWGTGLRLGQTESDHQVVARGSPRPQALEPVILKLWGQGFSINDGELRPYDDPDNRDFLETVIDGQIPLELRQMGNMVSVDVEDHRHEEFTQTKKVVKIFKGSGHTLGSPAPNTEVDNNETNQVFTTTNTTTSTATATATTTTPISNIEINPNEPSTNIQIRLADGSRITGQFNLTHTINDIHLFITSSRPQFSGQNFILVTSFPTKELSDGTETIEKAGLKNASLMQRLK